MRSEVWRPVGSTSLAIRIPSSRGANASAISRRVFLQAQARPLPGQGVPWPRHEVSEWGRHHEVTVERIETLGPVGAPRALRMSSLLSKAAPMDPRRARGMEARSGGEWGNLECLESFENRDFQARSRPNAPSGPRRIGPGANRDPCNFNSSPGDQIREHRAGSDTEPASPIDPIGAVIVTSKSAAEPHGIAKASQSVVAQLLNELWS